MGSDAVVPPPPPGFKLDQAVPPPPPGYKLDEGDHGWWAETGRAASGAIDTIKAAGDRAGKGPIEGMAQTGKAILAVPELAMSPLTGAIRSFGGRAIQGADSLLRKGATALYGEDKVPPALTFDEAAGKAELAGMAGRPRTGGALNLRSQAADFARHDQAVQAARSAQSSTVPPPPPGYKLDAVNENRRFAEGYNGPNPFEYREPPPDPVTPPKEPTAAEKMQGRVEWAKTADARGKIADALKGGEDPAEAAEQAAVQRMAAEQKSITAELNSIYGDRDYADLSKTEKARVDALTERAVALEDGRAPPQPPAGGPPPQPPAGGAPPQRVTAIQAARNAAGLIEKIFSPETVDANAGAAAAAIREMTGAAARETAKTGAALSPPRAFKFEPTARKIAALPEADRLDFIDYVEGRSGKYAGLSMRDPVLQKLADDMKAAFQRREARIQALPSHQQAAFIDDYLTHMWKDPNKARQALQQPTSGGTGTKQGSGASLSKRTVPTYRDGIAAGLEPLTTDPIEITMRYVASMDKFIGAQELLETAKNQGMIKYVMPRVVGGTGKPNSFIEPPGWKPLDGRGALRADGARAYAPEGFARVYNNWLSRGVYGANEDLGNAYDVLRRASNTITGAELSFSGYHFLTVGKAAFDNSLSQALYLARSGKPISAAKQLGRTVTAPVRYAVEGKQVKDVYLGISQGSRQLQNVVEKLEKAGGRATGKSYAPETEFSAKGSYWTALKKGALRGQMIADRAEAMGSPLGTAKVAFRNIGRIMDTVNQPLFEQYIPAVKNGAFRENLSNWLEVNPTASEEDVMNAARQIWDDMDDRFGEMVSDNMFMTRLIKQIGQLSLRSWSWFVGQDVRMLGGAARDVARTPFKKPPAGPTPGGGPGAGGPPRANPGPHDTRWTSKMDYAIAMPIVYGTVAAAYMLYKTGKAPESIKDLTAPQTGGTDPVTGQPERLLVPGAEKDVFGAMIHGGHELDGKTSKMISEAWHLWNNKDWRGDPIYSGAENAPPWLQQFWEYVGKNIAPISMQSLVKGRKQGSNLNRFEQMLGVREAPAYLTDKQAYDDMMKGIERRDYRKKERHDAHQRSLYEE